MNIKYSKHKHELKDDPLINLLLKSKEYLLKNSNVLVGIIIVIVFFIGASLVFNNIRTSSEGKAQEAFGKALISYNDKNFDKAIDQFRIVVENHRSAPQSIFSSFLLGRILFDQGKYDEAITWFENAVSQKKSAQFIGGEALEGIAACYEYKGDTKSAMEYLGKALNDKRISYRHSAIRWKMALLSSSKDFSRSRELCQQIIADTTAVQYHQQAQNLLATMGGRTSG